MPGVHQEGNSGECGTTDNQVQTTLRNELDQYWYQPYPKQPVHIQSGYIWEEKTWDEICRWDIWLNRLFSKLYIGLIGLYRGILSRHRREQHLMRTSRLDIQIGTIVIWITSLACTPSQSLRGWQRRNGHQRERARPSTICQMITTIESRSSLLDPVHLQILSKQLASGLGIWCQQDHRQHMREIQERYLLSSRKINLISISNLLN